MTPISARTGIALTVSLLLSPCAGPFALAQEDLRYFAPGNILPKTSLGINSRKVFFPEWTFPLKVGTATGHHAYIGTQLSAYHGVSWANDPRLFRYPSRDNQCEPRKWTMQPCPAGKGHQGVDIRAHDNQDDVWPVVAVEAGVVTSITGNTTVKVRNGSRTVRYLHMSKGSIADAGIRIGVSVTKGQQLGRVSCLMGGSCQTSLHLHFDAYSGSAGHGNFYHVYPSLIAAYRRAWGLDDNVSDGILQADPGHEVGSSAPLPGPGPEPGPGTRPGPAEPCDLVALADPLEDVDRNSFSSLWRHNCSLMGLVADEASGARSFVYYRPRKTLESLVRDDPVLFQGVNAGGRFTGTAKHYNRRCGTQIFAVEGVAADAGTQAIEVAGARQRLDTECRVIGSGNDVLRFTFVENVSPEPGSIGHTIPEGRKTFSEVTRNFLAITFYPNSAGEIEILPYFDAFPGHVATGGKVDSAGGLIPALATDEAGVAISRVWIRKRARHTNGLSITPRTIAHSMAGVDPAACDSQVNPTPEGIAAAGSPAAANEFCNRVVLYLRGYIGFGGGRGFATDYFGRAVAIDEPLNLADEATNWNWMRTMYSHESGRPPVIDRETFARGIRFGDDYIAAHYDQDANALLALSFYSDPCNFDQPGCRGDGDAEPTVSSLISELKTLREKVERLEGKLEELLAEP